MEVIVHTSNCNYFRVFPNQPSIGQSSIEFKNFLSFNLLNGNYKVKETPIDRFTEEKVFKHKTQQKLRGFIAKDGDKVKIIALQTTRL